MPAILVIDDDAAVRQLVENTLRSSGYRVIAVTDGRAGADAAARHPIAAAIVDLCMPELHGLETIRAFRTLAPDMPLIAMSELMSDRAGMMPDFLGMCLNLAGVRRLAKPFHTGDLLDLVARCCGHPVSGAGFHAPQSPLVSAIGKDAPHV